MKTGERIPIHDHSGFDSGGIVAASTVVRLAGSEAISSAATSFESPVATGTALSDGSSGNSARADHVHTNAYLGTVAVSGTAVADYVLTAQGAGSATWSAAQPAAGTAFPVSPTTNEHYWRNDLGEGYVYDGTRWVSETIYSFALPLYQALLPFSATQYLLTVVPNNSVGTLQGLWIIGAIFHTEVLTTNDATKYWNCAWQGDNIAGDIATFDTSGDAANASTRHRMTAGIVSTAPSSAINRVRFYFAFTKTSTPGNLNVSGVIEYRKIAT